MRLPKPRFTVSQLMIAAAVACCVAFNARIFSGLEDDLPPNDTSRVWSGRVVAFAVSPTAGGVVAWIVWRAFTDKPVWWGRAVLRGASAGLAAGGVAWSAATVFLCVGHGADGQTPLAAIIMGAEGAALHAVVGALLAVICWRSSPATSEVGTRGQLPEFLRSVDRPDSSVGSSDAAE